MSRFSKEAAEEWIGRDSKDYFGCHSGLNSKKVEGLETKDITKLIKKEILGEIKRGKLPEVGSSLSVKKGYYPNDFTIFYDANCDSDLREVLEDKLNGIVGSHGFYHSPTKHPYADERAFELSLNLYFHLIKNDLLERSENWYEGIMKLERYEKGKSQDEVVQDYVGAQSGINLNKVQNLNSSEKVRLIKKALSGAIKNGELVGKKAFGQVGSFQAPGKLCYDFQIKGLPKDMSNENYLSNRKIAKEIINSFNYNWNLKDLQYYGNDFGFFSSLEFYDENGGAVSDTRSYNEIIKSKRKWIDD